MIDTIIKTTFLSFTSIYLNSKYKGFALPGFTGGRLLDGHKFELTSIFYFSGPVPDRVQWAGTASGT